MTRIKYPLSQTDQSPNRISELNTPLGRMIAIASITAVHLLAFQDSKNIEKSIQRLRRRTKGLFSPGTNKPIESLRAELSAYFHGKLTSFTTPIHLHGTDFQKTAWHALNRIPFGETRSYADQARTIGTPSACRAVAGANSANQIALLIPCHRVIASNGTLGGYAGSIHRKQWLLDHEKQSKKNGF